MAHILDCQRITNKASPFPSLSSWVHYWSADLWPFHLDRKSTRLTFPIFLIAQSSVSWLLWCENKACWEDLKFMKKIWDCPKSTRTLKGHLLVFYSWVTGGHMNYDSSFFMLHFHHLAWTFCFCLQSNYKTLCPSVTIHWQWKDFPWK